MSVSVVLQHFASAIGEGPHWDSNTGCLYLADIGYNGIADGLLKTNGTIFKWNSSTNELIKKFFTDGCPTIAIPTSDPNKCITTQNRLLVKYDWVTDETEILDEVEKGMNTRFNDGKCDPRGRLFIGTMSNEKSPGVVFEEEVGSLYGFDKDKGRLVTMDTKITISNGMDWTSDGKKMFYIDSEPRKVYLFDYDIDAFKISNRRTAIDFSPFPHDDLGYPDGCTLDTRGNLWVACFDAGKVVCFDVETGKRLQEIKFPAKLITSCCFGGENLDQLFVTSSAYGVSKEDLRTSQSEAGSLFKVTGLGVKGFPMSAFQL